MSDHSRKKHAKAINRRRTLGARRTAVDARRNAVRAERDKQERYPPFIFETEDTPESFVALVQQAVSKFDFDDRAIFSEAEASFYRAVRAKGARIASEEFRHFQTGGLGWHEPGPDCWPRKLGHLVFRSIPREQLVPFIPYHDFMIAPHRQRILVRFRSLTRIDTSAGPFWHSTRKPTVLVQGQHRIVGFQRHLFEDGALDRIVPGGWFDYDGMGELFAYFDQCRDFEVARLYPDQTAISFFDDCAHGFWSRKVAVEVLGTAYRDDTEYSYRVGYCPTFIHDRFIVAKTLLPPGYRSTPEYGKILSARLPKEEKDRMVAAVNGLTIHTFVTTDDFSLLRWFHEQGIPQVISRRTAYLPV
ncbi:MAG: hypothetical protein J2P46_04690 [Zavarzinella sp.]|nr:hypothetical protein [Zavarzinella sp.]